MLKIKHMHGHPNEYLGLFYCDDYTNITLAEFIKEIADLAINIHPDDKDEQQKFRGEAWEVFSEIFFTLNASNPRWGINNYSPVPPNEDYGCDATGRNPNGDDCVIQDKYRSDPKLEINYDEYCHVVAAGYQQHKVDLSKRGSIYIFTTAYDMNYRAKNLAGDALVLLDREHIAKEVDNNKNFWQNAFNLIQESLS